MVNTICTTRDDIHDVLVSQVIQVVVLCMSQTVGPYVPPWGESRSHLAFMGCSQYIGCMEG